MKLKILACSLAAALAACGLIVTPTLAADNSVDSSAAMPAHGRLLQRIADQLNLTGEQRTRIKAVLAGEKSALAPLIGALHEARNDLRTAIRADDANEASVRAAAARVAAAEADLSVERMKLYGKIAPILTAAQRRQLADLQPRTGNLVDGTESRFGPGLGQ
jgi:Spy/CpxP family protein refolding chaperone